MSDFSFLALPNIEGMRFWWYIQSIGILVLFGVSLFFVIYFRLLYRRQKKVIHQLDTIDNQSYVLAKQLISKKIFTSSGKTKLVLFIDYLEKFVTNKDTIQTAPSYATISELLLSVWFTPSEAKACEMVVYSDNELSSSLSHRIDTYFIS
jgi:hypothetical protein